MTIQGIGVVVFLLALVSMLRGTPAGLDLFAASAVLGAAAGVTLPALGDIGLQPAHCLLIFVVIPVSLASGAAAPALRGFAFPRPGCFLLLAVAYGVLSAAFLPRVFAGATLINAIGSTASGLSSYAVPLGPTSGNVTQTAYFGLDLACFGLISAWAGFAEGRAAILRGVLAFAVANVIFALSDLASFWVGLPDLLEPIRNSSYVLQTGTAVLGLKRIAGSFTEASSFANASLGVLAFVTTLWLRGVRPKLTGPLALAHVVLLLLSTSSTAYVCLPIVLALLYVVEVKRVVERRASARSLAYLVFVPLGGVIVVLALMLSPSLWSHIQQILTVLIFDKDSSDSGVERGAWNLFAWRNFVDTFGWGVGLGSARASSFLLAVLANIGAIGGACYALFLAGVLAPTRSSPAPDQATAAVIAACRAACFCWVVAASVSGALVDLGLLFFVVAGLGDGLRAASRRAAYVTQPARFGAAAQRIAPPDGVLL